MTQIETDTEKRREIMRKKDKWSERERERERETHTTGARERHIERYNGDERDTR